MRILRINTTYNQGGAALSAVNIQKSVADLDVDTWMLSARGSQNIEKHQLSLDESKLRLGINALSYRLLGIEGFANHGLWRRILSNIDNFDLVHLHNVHGYYMPLDVLRKLLSMPCVWTLHDFWLVTGGPGFPRSPLEQRSKYEHSFPFTNFRYPAEWIDRSVKRRLRSLHLIEEFNPSLVAITQAMADRLISMGLSASNLSIIPHGLFGSDPPPNAAKRIEAREKRGWPIDKHIFLFCAAKVDNPSKACAVFLNALNTLKGLDSWVAYIVGEKSGAARRRVDELGLNVQFEGGVSGHEMREIFCACDTYVTTTLDETFGRTVVEALAEGTFVVCTDLPVLREVTGGNAYYFPPGDFEVLGMKLKQLLTEGAIYMPDIAKKIRKRFSRDLMAQKYIELYRAEIKRKKS